jgi:hypothetical protein
MPQPAHLRVSIKAHGERDAGRAGQQAPSLVGSDLELRVCAAPLATLRVTPS